MVVRIKWALGYALLHFFTLFYFAVLKNIMLAYWLTVNILRNILSSYNVLQVDGVHSRHIPEQSPNLTKKFWSKIFIGGGGGGVRGVTFHTFQCLKKCFEILPKSSIKTQDSIWGLNCITNVFTFKKHHRFFLYIAN